MPQMFGPEDQASSAGSEGDRAEAQEVDLHRAEYGTKWMLAQRGE